MSIHQIYFLQRADGLVKIGTTRDFQTRLATLTKSHGMLAVIRLVNGDRRREHKLHHQFRRFHEYGEWFRPERGLLLQEIIGLEDGPEIIVGRESPAGPIAAYDSEFMRNAVDRLNDLIGMRSRLGALSRDDAITALDNEYGLSLNFIQHVLKGRAASLTSEACSRINDAWLSEASLLADALNAKRSAVEAEQSADRELLEIGAELARIEAALNERHRLRALASEIEAKRAVR